MHRTPSTRAKRALRFLVCSLAAMLVVLPALPVLPVRPAAVDAAPQRYHIGEPWEEPIESGVDAQNSSMRRRVPADTIVGRAERAARRDKSVSKLYLLARAFGLRAQVGWARAEKAKSEAVKRGLQAQAQKDFEAAMSEYRRVLQRAARCYFAHHDMGVLELQRDPKARKLAFSHLSRAYELNRRYTPTHRQLIRLYMRGKQYEHAVPLIQRVLQLEPEDDEARLHLVSCYMSLEKFDLASEVLDPLVAKKKSDLYLLFLRAQIDARTGKPKRSVETFVQVARANPNVPAAFQGILALLSDAETAKQFENADELRMLALRGLKRLARDEKDIARIDRDIAILEHRAANPDGGTNDGPPTTAQALHMLASPEAKDRANALYFLMVREEKPTAEVVRAVVKHLVPKTEAEGIVRSLAVRALGMMSGTRVIPVIRHALGDPEAGVRVLTVDALAGIAARDPSAKGPVLVILGPLVEDEDVELASAARQGILRVAEVSLPDLGESSDDAAHRAAFREWWAGTEGEDILINALEAYHESGDRAADQALVPYLSSPAFYVFRAACHALEKAASRASGEPWKAWYAAMPRFTVERLKRENHAALAAEMAAWVAKRPGS